MKSPFMLETRELGRRLETHWIWQKLNLKVEAGSRMVLSGPTGSGKTLLLRVLAGLDDPDQGLIFFQGRKQESWKMPEYRTR
ncbi:MAG: ATP-binding cassette domain-containing protein, partial [SAR324 cluster bacterium]|nr:ATP-binding cassette domain-containing protein [SAR324 cluster bacterium]